MPSKHSSWDEEVSIIAGVAKLVDAVDLKSIGLIDRAGSSPAPGTTSSSSSSSFSEIARILVVGSRFNLGQTYSSDNGRFFDYREPTGIQYSG